MQEAFRKAIDESNGAGNTAFVVLTREYRNLGHEFFRAAVVGYPINGRRMEIPSEQHMIDECLTLHGRLVKETVAHRTIALAGLTDGLRLSEVRLDPNHKDFLPRLNRVFSPASQLFLIYLSVLYDFKTPKNTEFGLSLVTNSKERQASFPLNLPAMRLAVANWADTVNYGKI